MKKHTHPDSAAFSTWVAEKPHLSEYGLTKREYFAAMAMQGLIAQTPSAIGAKLLAEEALKCADALIEALNREEGK